MTTIDQKRLLINQTLILPDEQEICLDSQLNPYVAIHIHLRFLPGDGSSEPELARRVEGFNYYLDFKGWGRAGQPRLSPVYDLGQVVGSNLTFQVFQQWSDNSNIITVQVLLG